MPFANGEENQWRDYGVHRPGVTGLRLALLSGSRTYRDDKPLFFNGQEDGIFRCFE
jgi:hypothetical protein